MITDQETNFVYFSKLLPQRHPKFFKELKAILQRKGIEHGLLPYTKDIWCRDYMPVQIAGNAFVQLKYDPCYLHGSKEDIRTITDASETCKTVGIRPVVSDIKIDGGNIVRSKTKVIITERILCENPQYSRKELIKKIKKLLNVRQLIMIPKCPDDPYGHADGCIRFINSDSVIVNELDKEERYFAVALKKVLRESRLKYKGIPWFIDNDHRYPESAVGNYINYLEMGDLILIPEYKGHDKCNRMALAALRKVFGVKKIIEPVESTEIAKEGGVLNCVSWNITK